MSAKKTKVKVDAETAARHIIQAAEVIDAFRSIMRAQREATPEAVLFENACPEIFRNVDAALAAIGQEILAGYSEARFSPERARKAGQS